MLPFGRFLRHAVIIGYLTVTASAFLFTMTRIQLPFMPYRLMHFSYGMMAPYQGDAPTNADVVAEGRLPDGSWENIDLHSYIPGGRGERIIRLYMTSFRAFSEEVRIRKFTDLAAQLLDRERDKGKSYQAVRLWYELWERSLAGWEAMRKDDLLLEKKLLTTVQ